MNEKYVRTRSIVSLVGIDENDFVECVNICLPKFCWAVARTFLYDYGQRQTSFAVSYDVSTYETPDSTLFDKIDASIAEGLGACEVTCSEIVQALDGISASLSASGGCGCQGGSAGAGDTEAPEEPFVDDGSTTFPPLYTDRDEYIDNKCGLARKVIDSMLTDLAWLKTVNLSTIAVIFFVGALITPIPGDELLVLVGFVLSIFIQGLLASTVQAIIDEINSKLEDLVCVVFDADTSANAQVAFLSELGLSGIQGALVDNLIANDSFNPLFQYGPLESGFEPCNCDDCGCGLELNVGSTSDQVTFESEDIGGGLHGISVWVNHVGGTDPCTDTCGPETTFVVDSVSGWTAIPAGNSYQINHFPSNCSTPVNKYGADVVWPDTETGRNFQVWSSTSFTLERSC